jgi:3-hydroxybutyryl-CoA dehydratase
VLCIGDGVITDVLGAQNQKLACLFIAKGIHGEAAIGPDGLLNPEAVLGLLAAEKVGRHARGGRSGLVRSDQPLSSTATHNKNDRRTVMQGLFLEDLTVGQSAELVRDVGEADIVAFAQVTGDTNPVHLDADYAATTSFGERIAHGMLSAGYISAVLGTTLPGPGAVYLSQSLAFKRPVKIGVSVTARATVTAIDAAKAQVTLSTVCLVNGKKVVDGEAVVLVPTQGRLMTPEDRSRLEGPTARGAGRRRGAGQFRRRASRPPAGDRGSRQGRQRPEGPAGRDHLRSAPAPAVPPHRTGLPADDPTEQQARVLGGMGVDLLYLLPFDFQMASFSDREFVETGSGRWIGREACGGGFDISFGKGRTGSAD